MATLQTTETRPGGDSHADGKAYFETSTNKMLVWNATAGAWIELDSDGTGAVGYALDANYEIPLSSAPVVHLDASELSLSDGASVTSWPDRTTNGNDISAVGTPLFYNNVYGGKPAIHIDLGDGFTDSSFFTNNDFSSSEATMFIVYEPSGSQTTFVGTRTGNNDLTNFNASTRYPGLFLNGRLTAAAPPSSGLVVESCAVSQSDDTYELSIDGGTVVEESLTSNSLTFYGDTFSIGNTVNSSSYANFRGQGHVFEVLVFNSKLSVEHTNIVGAYLATKYSTNYVSKSAYSSSYDLDNSYSTTVTPTIHFDVNIPDSVYSGTSLAVDGDPITSWRDRSGLASLKMETAALQPSFTTARTPISGANSTKGVYFDGTQYLSLQNAGSHLRYSSNSDNSMFLIFEPDNKANYSPVSDKDAADYLRFGGVSYASLIRDGNLNAVSHNGLLRTTGIHLLGVYSNTNSQTYTIEENGAVVISENGVTPADWAYRFDVARSYATSVYLKGWVYEILYFPGELSSVDKASLLNYAKNKYGVS